MRSFTPIHGSVRGIAGACLILLAGCGDTDAPAAEPAPDWVAVVDGFFGPGAAGGLIVLTPDEVPPGLAARPVLVVPADATRFVPFGALAFLPDDAGAAANGAPANGGPATGTGDGPGAARGDPDPGEFTDWPPVTDLPVAPDDPEWPRPQRPPPGTEDLDGEDLDRALDEALRKAFEDAETDAPAPPPGDPPVEEPEEPHPLEDEFFRPRIPPGWRGWLRLDVDLDLSPPGDTVRPFDLDWRPRWRDLERERPWWWPPNRPYDPGSRSGLPDEWRPRDHGFRVGGWRVYFVPAPPR